jgi:uncharacterized protein (TIGR00661 family)
MDQLFEENPPEKPLRTGLLAGQASLQRCRILVVPLDWGLGHATRCIPIIRELLKQGIEVWLAGEAAQEKLLKAEFPDLPFLSLPGYRVHYARSNIGLLKNIFFQIPKILRAMKKENAWLKKMADEHGFDAVIADNRYGLYHSTIPSVFITHQLTIKSSLGKWTERILQKRNYRFINRFTECWVPDVDEKNNLAGDLSHPEKKPAIPLHYIGVLSRFEIKSTQKEKNHLLIILSGPEPQRSLLENKIINEVSNYNGTATIVRGLPGSASVIPSTNIIHFYNHLPSVELNKEMQQAEYIISRSGYSTIMDVVKLQKKSILIPTPGQTEQEYLANYLLQKQIAFCVSQKEFSLTKALQKAKQFSYHLPTSNNEQLLGKVIMNFIASMNG